MGTTRHQAIIVTGQEESILKAHKKAKDIFAGALVSEIVKGTRNYVCSFFIAPDGSNIYYDENLIQTANREKFTTWLKRNGYEFVYVEFPEEYNDTAYILDYTKH